MRSPVNQKLGRDTPFERNAGVLAEEEQRCDLHHFHRTVLLGLCFYLANYLIYFFTPVWSMDPSQDAFLLRWIPPQKPMGAYLHLLWGGAPSLLATNKASLHVQTEKSSLTSGVVLLLLTSTRCLARRPTVSYLKRPLQGF